MKCIKKLVAVALAAVLALAMLTACDGSSNVPNATEQAEQIVNSINEVRTQNGLEALKTNTTATDVAAKMVDLYVKSYQNEITKEEYKTKRDELRNIQVEGKYHYGTMTLHDKASGENILTKDAWTKKYANKDKAAKLAFGSRGEYIGAAVKTMSNGKMVAIIVFY